MSDRTLELDDLIEDIFGPGGGWTRERMGSLEALRRVYRARGEVRNGSERAKDAWREVNGLMTELAGMLGKKGRKPEAEIRRRVSELKRAAEQAPEEMKSLLKEMMLTLRMEDLGRALRL